MSKALNIVKTVLTWAIVIVAVGMMIFTVVSSLTFNRNDRNIFGYKAFIVNTDSMAATDFKAGDLIFTKKVDTKTLKEGDIITFQSQASESYGEVITHKIRKITTDAEGELGFITYGTTTGVDDETVVSHNFVLGKYTGHIAGVGKFFAFLKTPVGYIICILIPFMTLIIIQGIKCIRLFRQYKREQMEELESERKEIEAEREENAKMLEELRLLKEQLAKQNAGQADQAPAAKESEEE